MQSKDDDELDAFVDAIADMRAKFLSMEKLLHQVMKQLREEGFGDFDDDAGDDD